MALFTITADVYGRQRTERTESPREAMQWVWEFQDKGAPAVYIRDERRTYTVEELKELARA